MRSLRVRHYVAHARRRYGLRRPRSRDGRLSRSPTVETGALYDVWEPRNLWLKIARARARRRRKWIGAVLRRSLRPNRCSDGAEIWREAAPWYSPSLLRVWLRCGQAFSNARVPKELALRRIARDPWRRLSRNLARGPVFLQASCLPSLKVIGPRVRRLLSSEGWSWFLSRWSPMWQFANWGSCPLADPAAA